MDIKQLRNVISQLPDDMLVILGSYYRNNPHKLNLNSVAYVSDVYCKDNDPMGGDTATYSDQKYKEFKQEKYEQYKLDLEEAETPQSIEEFWAEYVEERDHGFAEYGNDKCFVLFPELR
jgi:hypothetical protein